MIMLRFVALAVLLPLSTSFASVSIGQKKTPDAVVEQAGKPTVILDTLKSPRATMEAFLHAMNDIKRDKPERIDDAVTALDLSSVNRIVREERGSDLAWMLLEVMDRTKVIKTESIPGRTQGKPYLFKTYQNGSVRISRMEDGRWLFDSETIKSLPQILDELSDKKRIIGTAADQSFLPWHIRIRQWLPESFKEISFLLENWQWIGIFIIIIVGVVADKIIALILQSGVRRWRSHSAHPEFKEISDQVLRPLGLMVGSYLVDRY